MRKSFLTLLDLFFVIVIVMLIFLLIPRRGHLLNANPSGFSIVTDTVLKVHQIFDLGVQFNSASQDQTIILRPVRFSGDLPARIRLLHESIVLPSDSPPNPAAGVGGLRGWPPGSDIGSSYIVHPLDGYQLPPHSYATIVLSFSADAPGAYILGPFTVHADASGLFGSILGQTFSEETYTQYGVMCVQVSQELCQSVEDGIKAGQ